MRCCAAAAFRDRASLTSPSPCTLGCTAESLCFQSFSPWSSSCSTPSLCPLQTHSVPWGYQRSFAMAQLYPCKAMCVLLQTLAARFRLCLLLLCRTTVGRRSSSCVITVAPPRQVPGFGGPHLFLRSPTPQREAQPSIHCVPDGVQGRPPELRSSRGVCCLRLMRD